MTRSIAFSRRAAMATAAALTLLQAAPEALAQRQRRIVGRQMGVADIGALGIEHQAVGRCRGEGALAADRALRTAAADGTR